MNCISAYLNTVSSFGTGGKRGEGIRKRVDCETKEEGRKEECEELSLTKEALKLQWLGKRIFIESYNRHMIEFCLGAKCEMHIDAWKLENKNVNWGSLSQKSRTTLLWNIHSAFSVKMFLILCSEELMLKNCNSCSWGNNICGKPHIPQNGII